MFKSNSGFSGVFGGSGSILPRQIFDLTNFQMLKIWLFGCSELKPLVIRNCSCTHRCGAFKCNTLKNEICSLLLVKFELNK